MKRAARVFRSVVALAVLAAPAGCVFDEGSSLHRDSTVDVGVVEGAPSCADLGYSDALALTLDRPESGTVTRGGGLAITLETDGDRFAFSASADIAAVIAQGEDAARVYDYTPPALGDVGLSAPPPTRRGNVPRELAQVSFCRDAIACVLGPAYWKKHSEYGPLAYDDTWMQLPAGADTPFFSSGKSYYEMLWKEGAEQGAYQKLARAYIAAELSQLAGASGGAIADSFAEAREIFEAYSPEELRARSSSGELRGQVLDVADDLGAYHRGRVGPGLCDEGEGRGGSPRR